MENTINKYLFFSYLTTSSAKTQKKVLYNLVSEQCKLTQPCSHHRQNQYFLLLFLSQKILSRKPVFQTADTKKILQYRGNKYLRELFFLLIYKSRRYITHTYMLNYIYVNTFERLLMQPFKILWEEEHTTIETSINSCASGSFVRPLYFHIKVFKKENTLPYYCNSKNYSFIVELPVCYT